MGLYFSAARVARVATRKCLMTTKKKCFKPRKWKLKKRKRKQRRTRKKRMMTMTRGDVELILPSN